MQPQQRPLRQKLVNNLLWLGASIALAFFIWVIATLESDPINEVAFRNIPIQVDNDEGLIVTDQSREIVTVNIRAPQSILDQLAPDDIQVAADLRGLRAGEHRVDLQATVSRRALADPSPRRIMVDLENALEQLVPVDAVISEDLPRGFEIEGGEPVVTPRQVLVRGPQSLVTQVISGQIVLNLSQRRNPFSDELRVLPVDVDGKVVGGVQLEPAIVQVNVPIQTRSDIREVSVTPNILAGTLPTGYALTSINYEPQVLLLSGPPDALENAPGTLFTEPIDLSGRTSAFQEMTTVQLPNSQLFIIGDQAVQVTIDISALLTSRQFDRVPVEVIGLPAPAEAELLPDEVTVLLTGPQSILDNLTDADLRAVLDLNGLDDGNYQLEPDVVLNLDQSVLTNVAVLPGEIDVTIRNSGESTVSPG
jgi:YbbR domain-containing protein